VLITGCLICTVLLLSSRRVSAQPDTVVTPPATTPASTGGPGTPPAAVQPAPVSLPLNRDRILKVIPNFQTVEDSNQKIAPMTVKEKWHLAWKNVIDPFNIGSAALGAAWSQADGGTPKYGRGGEALAKRFGAAIGDSSSQTVFATGAAVILHQDPRYFRKGPSSNVLVRVADSLKQIVVARQDSGARTFNASNILGMAAGIGFSNVYYPSSSRTGTVMLGRVVTSLSADAMGNLLSEFWPDVRKKVFHKH
jgi:hypothetical protein